MNGPRWRTERTRTTRRPIESEEDREEKQQSAPTARRFLSTWPLGSLGTSGSKGFCLPGCRTARQVSWVRIPMSGGRGRGTAENGVRERNDRVSESGAIPEVGPGALKPVRSAGKSGTGVTVDTRDAARVGPPAPRHPVRAARTLCQGTSLPQQCDAYARSGVEWPPWDSSSGEARRICACPTG